MAPSLSVITITKDDPKGLAATLLSLAPLVGSGLRWEHLIVDGSGETPAVQIPNGWPLVFLREPPTGIYSAMNSGTQSATGDVVWFLNGGDRLKDLGALEKMLSEFERDPELELTCAAADLVAEGEFSFVSFPRTTLHRSLLSGRSLCHQAMLFRRRTFAELGPYSTQYPIAGDEEFLLRFFLSRRKSLCVPDRLVYFDTTGVSHRCFEQRYRELRDLGRKLMRGNVRPLDYARYHAHQRMNGFRAHLFAAVRGLPLLGRLRESWLGWRRWSLRYR